MTNATSITSACGDEGLTIPTPVQSAFLRLLHALDRCIAAERQLLETDAGDFDSARAACEMAGETLSMHFGELLAMPESGPSDKSLRRLAFVMNSLLSIENNADRAYFAAALLDHAPLFDPEEFSPTGPMLRGLHLACLTQTALLVDLRDPAYEVGYPALTA
ncbi:hypothetical protein [Rhodovulum adriaticum]|uniref:Uncharacterized protein n=1 Tax=Rhodovulum adriaticum TaxID=35804 RepID=A0A4R2NGG0_RHOAD|nr:hypothetical protein [Rhodovulum adriaticum]MBK1637288.1 hypothetical protein [Rhodovulum adriaticum]TCP20235.1 hypothetical protein EV656_12215 [Rhodovulum adriaticum]